MQVQIKTGLINKGTYGSYYDAGIDGVIEPVVAKVKTGKRGRPANPVPVYFQCNDLFGRVADKVKTTTKGRVIVGKASV